MVLHFDPSCIILLHSYTLSLKFIETVELAGVFAIKTQLIWATYVLSVCLYFVSITRNVRPVGEWIPSPILALHI